MGKLFFGNQEGMVNSHFLKKLIADGANELPITDPQMTRFCYYFRRWSQLCIEKL